MSAALLRLEGVGKTYPPTVQASQRLKAFWQLVTRGASQGGTRILSDINLEVRPGESVGIIGENGAGKSTLLKMITGVVAPTQGHMEARGTRAALLELGAGFDLEYSGLDNLKMNAAFLGLSRADIQANMDRILAFADIGESIHEPVKHYSSGMVVRLGFAIVAAVRPDLLITDEVLAVGDESFQKKCIRWMEGYLKGGGTLLMVSHNLYQVQRLCRHACWIHEGRMHMAGDVFEVTQAYLAWHEKKDALNKEQQEAARREPAGNYRVRRLDLTPAPDPVTRLAMGDRLEAVVELESPDDRPPVASVGIVRVDGTAVYGMVSDEGGFSLQRLGPGRYAGRVVFPDLKLLPGGYTLRAHALDPEGLRLVDTLEESFTVTGESLEVGVVRLDHEWLPLLAGGDRSQTGTDSEAPIDERTAGANPSPSDS